MSKFLCCVAVNNQQWLTLVESDSAFPNTTATARGKDTHWLWFLADEQLGKPGPLPPKPDDTGKQTHWAQWAPQGTDKAPYLDSTQLQLLRNAHIPLDPQVHQISKDYQINNNQQTLSDVSGKGIFLSESEIKILSQLDSTKQ